MKERMLMTNLLHQHLNQAPQRMKFQVDQKRTERNFSVGDWVFLNIQPYVQSSAADRANHKLAFCYYGPFQVEQWVGATAYKMRLSPRSLIHPVIHVSQLHQALPPTEAVQQGLPTLTQEQAQLQVL